VSLSTTQAPLHGLSLHWYGLLDFASFAAVAVISTSGLQTYKSTRIYEYAQENLWCSTIRPARQNISKNKGIRKGLNFEVAADGDAGGNGVQEKDEDELQAEQNREIFIVIQDQIKIIGIEETDQIRAEGAENGI
jgi:hypothetical protein